MLMTAFEVDKQQQGCNGMLAESKRKQERELHLEARLDISHSVRNALKLLLQAIYRSRKAFDYT